MPFQKRGADDLGVRADNFVQGRIFRDEGIV